MTEEILNERYVLEEKVGEGGMAVTYRARDLLLNRTVAVKQMRDRFAADPDFVARFRKEGRAAGQLTHENIAHIYDVCHDGRVEYIVMEFVEGTELKARLRAEGALPLMTALEIGRQIAAALEAAHRAGLVHRDITPRNIMMTRDGRVKVTDFGIAKQATDEEDTGVIMGSAHYMSPEQANGEATTASSDLYSLGAVLFEMVTGRTVFTGDTPLRVAQQHYSAQPPTPRALKADLPQSVETLILRLLAKKAADRYASASEVKAALTQLVNRFAQDETMVMPGRAGAMDETVVHRRGAAAQQPMATPEPVETKRSGSGGAWALVLVFFLLAAAAGGLTYYIMNQGDGSKPPVVTPVVEMVTVPDLTSGMPKEQALQVLEIKKLVAVVREEAHETVEAGKVIRQDPAAGSEAAQYSSVVVWVSTGPPPPTEVVVPNVAGLTEQLAGERLKEAGLVPGAVRRSYDSVSPRNTVAATEPPAGTVVKPKSSVALVVSDGAQPPPPPDRVVQFLYEAIVPDVGAVDTWVKIQKESPPGAAPETILAPRAMTPGESVPPQALERKESEAVLVRMLVGPDEESLTKHEEKTFGPGQ